MIRRILPSLILTALATTFSFGLIFAAHDYIAQISGATEGASLISSLNSADPQQLAFGGYTTPSPSPSQTHTTQSQTQGRGGAAPQGSHDPAMGGGTTRSQPSHSSGPGGDGCGGCGGGTYRGSNGNGSPSRSNSPSGGGGRPSENSGTGPRDSFGGGRNTSNAGTPTGGGHGSDPTNNDGGTRRGTNDRGSDPTNNDNGTRAGSYSGGSVNTTNGDTRDHQDTAASRAQEQQAQQTRETQEAAHYAETLRGFGSGDPTPGRTPSGISQRVSDTVSVVSRALGSYFGDLGGQPQTPQAQPGRITGLDGDVPVYEGTGITKDDFSAPTDQTTLDDVVNGLRAPVKPSTADVKSVLQSGFDPANPRNITDLTAPNVNTPQVDLAKLTYYAKYGQVTKGYTTKPYKFELSPKVARSILANNISPLERDKAKVGINKMSDSQAVIASIWANQGGVQDFPVPTTLGIGAIENHFSNGEHMYKGKDGKMHESDYQGPAQIGTPAFNQSADAVAKALGKKDIYGNISAGVSYAKYVSGLIKSTDIRDVYTAYNQGPAGFNKLKNNPNTPAAQSVGLDHVRANLRDKYQSRAGTITGDQFRQIIGSYPNYHYEKITGQSLPSGQSANAPADNPNTPAPGVTSVTPKDGAKPGSPATTKRDTSEKSTIPGAGVVHTVVSLPGKIADGIKTLFTGNGSTGAQSQNSSNDSGGRSSDFFPIADQYQDPKRPSANPTITTPSVSLTSDVPEVISALIESDDSIVGKSSSSYTGSDSLKHNNFQYNFRYNGSTYQYNLDTIVDSSGIQIPHLLALIVSRTDSNGTHSYAYIDTGPDGSVDALSIGSTIISNPVLLETAQDNYRTYLQETLRALGVNR